MKLGLGTVQFGINYGINNTLGKPGSQEIARIIRCAAKNGIFLLDTAADYGDSEEVLGLVLRNRPDFQIVTKVSKSAGPKQSVLQSLARLGQDHLYGVLIHQFEQFTLNPKIGDELLQLKDDGLVNKVGFSLYSPEQLEFLFEKRFIFDLIQIPYNVLDQRFEPFFGRLKAKGIEIHVRSVFLQGLFFRDPVALPDFFDPITDKLAEIGHLSRSTGRSIQSLCLNFADANKQIDKIIIGVDSMDNLESNVMASKEGISPAELSRLTELKETNEQMILPFNWKIK